ncbi:MAG: hypothetical protein ABS49_04400 [Erythrobacter sp. SCN 62-14]|nr:MAG: hypothetical protein ABS49_04400 [Erythrobacter sp. SCN 62-14]
MAKRAALGKGILWVFVPIAVGDLFWVCWRAGDSVGIGEPARQIAVAATLRTERRVIGMARTTADRAGLGGGLGH